MFQFRDYSISKKLKWMNMLVGATTLLLACAAFVAYDLITFRESLVSNLSIQAQIVGSNSVSALLFNDPSSAEKTLSALQAAPHIEQGSIYTPEGEPFAAYWRDPARRAASLPAIPEAQTEVHWFRDRQITVVRSIVFQGKPAGVVCIQSDLREWTERLQRYAVIVAGVLLVSLVAAWLTSSVVGRAIADPIVRLAETARVVSLDKNYSVRATPAHNRDELAVLIATFNEMLAQIQDRDTALRSEIAERERAEMEIRQLTDQLEERVKERTVQLEEANKELEAFTYSVAHDLRAPLRHISGFSKILVEDFASMLDTEAQRYLQRIQDGARKMGQLVDELLGLARVGRQSLNLQAAGLNSIVAEVISMLQPEFEGRQVEWKIADLPFVECDPSMMKQVFQNLLSNALKYSRPRAQAVIEVGSVHKDGQVVIFVRDNGVGFNMKYADKLFGVFQRLHRVEDFEGTGVGLATVHRIIKKHQGRVWVEAELDRGATFYFTTGSVENAATNAQTAIVGAQS